MPKGLEKASNRHPNNHWSTEEVVLAVFLRSRNVGNPKIVLILNERYAPKVRKAASLRSKLLAVRVSESSAGRIDLTYDKNFIQKPNVDRWIMSEIGDPQARSALLTFTEHELEVLEMIPSHLVFSSEDSLIVRGPGQTSAKPATGRRDDSLPAVGPSQVLDHTTGAVMTGLGRMPDPSSLNRNERIGHPAWPVWDATLEGLFPGMGLTIPGLRPPAGESSSTMQSGASHERAHDPYHQSQDLEELNPEGEEGGDESDEDEVDDDDDDYDSEYRLPRDENDKTWYDEAQEEEDV